MITTNVNSIEYVGNGSSKTFAIPFPYFHPSYLLVTTTVGGVTSVQTYGVNFTVETSSVVFISAPVTGVVITIRRNIPRLQSIDFQDSDRMPVENIELAVDLLTAIIQDQTYLSGLALLFPVGEPTPVTNTLPEKSTRKNKVLGFGPNGNLKLFSFGDIITEVLETANNYESIEVTGDLTITSDHKNKAVHLIDPIPSVAQITVTLPDAAVVGDDFFCSINKTGVIPIVFYSEDTINAEVLPATLVRENVGVIVYTRNGVWEIKGGLGAGGGSSNTINVTQQSNTWLGPTPPDEPYPGQLWIDTSDNNQWKRWNSSTEEWDVVTKILQSGDFGTGVRPIVRVAALPAPMPDADYPEGSLVYLTTDKKLYRTDGASWIKAVAFDDVTGKRSAADIIEANSIVGGLIQASAIVADHIGTNTIVTSAANIGAAIISDAHIADLSADKISAGTINAAIEILTAQIQALQTQSGSHVFNGEDETRLMPAVGTVAYYSGAEIVNGTIPEHPSWYYFTHDDLIFFNWTQGSTGVIDNRMGKEVQDFITMLNGTAYVTAGSLVYGTAYRTRTAGGAWSAWSNIGLDRHAPYLGSGVLTVSLDYIWGERLNIASNVDVQFGLRLSKASASTVSVPAFQLRTFAFNL